MADAPHAFLSYTRLDDRFHGGAITVLRERLELGVQVVTGQEFKIFQDLEGIAFGKHWPSRMDEALKQARFLIPIVTPTFFVRPICREELVRFLEYEKAAGRRDRILPIYFVKIRDLEQRKARDELVREVSEREWEEWLDFADLAADDHRLRPAIRRVAERIAERIEEAIAAFEADRVPSLTPITPAPPSTMKPVGALAATSEAAPSSPLVGEGGGEGSFRSSATIPPHPPIESGAGSNPLPRRGEGIGDAPDERSRPSALSITRSAGPTIVRPAAPAIMRPREVDLPPGTVFRDLPEPWCPEMVVIPAGEFVMGSSPEEQAQAVRDGASANWVKCEGPQHRVVIARPFALGRYTVTFAEYDHFCERTSREKPSDQRWGRGRMPVINVSCVGAAAYCRWLSGETGQGYRLPSEAEWEHACRAGTTGPFWTGPTISTDQANYDGNYTYGSGRQGVYRRKTVAVDDPSFPANPFGLWHMHGNVWEWCNDTWHDSYEGALADGSAWMEGDFRVSVRRGGSWCDLPRDLRSATRNWNGFMLQLNSFGLRVARTLTS